MQLNHFNDLDWGLALEHTLNENDLSQSHFFHVDLIDVIVVSVADGVKLLLLDVDQSVVHSLLGPVELEQV